jgi:hypothetical protein
VICWSPYLHDLGERWARGEVSVAQEHFASNLLRGRLLGLARGWGQGHGPAAVLACLPGEQHDLGLIAFGLTLYRRGWRIIYLGPDTPIATIGQATESLPPDLVVLAGTVPELFAAHADAIADLARQTTVVLGVYRVGDRVMQLRNNYDKGTAGVFNGSVGQVTAISLEDQELRVLLDEDEEVGYGFDELDELTHAYAVSIHRSQGSEYPCVVVPVTTSAWLMLQRNLLYTAVTRARRIVVLVGSRRALAKAVRTHGAGHRYTTLTQRLQLKGPYNAYQDAD